ncbi:hypothetical protein JGH11_00545 [Dysgonomonas sp. Marseille-P4677]|uniref:hypothetical protein n=1 Tax=Dysgonomonas sp. Marseille-P4677 TaxID=2364790 RepID=UPI00191335CC|nr:hypothetical protein [Dysgonomonas sp. Marseille-P4677]MBK5719347.1 hypothetical protein [Dysgonomonas sp. Marseille-P4677]
MQNYYRNTLIFLLLFLLSCNKKDDGALLRLNIARQFYAEKQYQKAKDEIDSLKILYPKSYDEIRAGLAFLDTIRRAENVQTITECDSLIILYEPEITKMKAAFSFQKNKEYQETGTYIPKESVSGGVITQTTLRSGVIEDGTLYIESVFVGSKQKHNQIKVSTKDGSYAQSLPVNDDGLNYRFSNMGKEYEIIRFAGNSENGIARFIFTNAQVPLTVSLEGQGKYSYQISQTIKSAISKSFQLSTMMLQLDSLKTAKEKAEYHIYYLDNKKDKATGELTN